MLSSRRFLSLVLLGVLLSIANSHAQATFTGRLPRGVYASRVLDAIHRFILTANTDPGAIYVAGMSFTANVDFGHGESAIIRLWLFNRDPRRLDGTCVATPIWNQVMGGQRFQESLLQIYYALAEQARNYNFLQLEAAIGNVAIQYLVLNPRIPNPGGHTALLASASSQLLNSGEPNCWVHGASLISGENAAIGSYLVGGSSIFSPSRAYKLTMQKDCNLVLYFQGFTAIWATGTRGKAEGCYLTLQMDGNLVLVNKFGKGLWASNVYCQPQPSCEVTSALVVEDNGHAAIYHTDERRIAWKAP